MDQEYRESFINIEIEQEKELNTEINVKMEFDNFLKNGSYKIGDNTNSWKEYTGEFKLTSYQVLENNMQNSDGRTINIYGKSEDASGNKIIIKKVINALDLDMPSDPQINFYNIADYPIMTDTGMKINYNFSIQFDNSRNDITNYYSIDKGITWIEYDENNINNENRPNTLYAKSVKNVSGLEKIVKGIVKAKSGNALPAECYDLDETTYKLNADYYFNVDSNLIGSTIRFRYLTGNGDGWRMYIYCLGESNNVLSSWAASNGKDSYVDLEIKENCTKFRILGDRGSATYEVKLNNKPSIKETKIYPILTSTGIRDAYSEIEIVYYQTAVKKLYMINNGQWQDYEQKLELNVGDKLKTKSIDINGEESIVTEYEIKINSDEIPEKAYKDASQVYYGGNYYLNVDSSVIGKTVRISYRTTNGDAWGLWMGEINSSGATLIGWSAPPGQYSYKDFNITEGCTRILIKAEKNSGIREVKIID